MSDGFLILTNIGGVWFSGLVEGGRTIASASLQRSESGARIGVQSEIPGGVRDLIPLN
jgi:hypothetical protein